MSHVDDGTLHALVDGALDDGERGAVEAHLATCGDCARRVAEASAMSRQVLSLLGALDAVSAPVRIEPAVAVAATVAPASVQPQVTPLGRRMVTLRRVALAASVLLVAGVSYEVGQRREVTLDTATEADAAPTGMAPPPSEPSVMDSAQEAFAPPAAPTVQSAPRAGQRDERASAPMGANRRGEAVAASHPMAPSPASITRPAPLVATPPAPSVAELSQRKAIAERQGTVTSEVAADRAADGVTGQVASRIASRADAQEQSRADQRAVPSQQSTQQSSQQPSQQPRASQRQRNVVAAGDAGSAAPLTLSAVTRPVAGLLAGYHSLDDVVMPAVTRRRYVAADGTTLVLLITPSTTDVPRPTARMSPEFTVSTVNGRSTVRWQVPGLTYELQGALSPDSLVKLATQLK